MLDKTLQDALGREMRKRDADRPKGAIPDRLWRLLLAMETASGRPAGSASQPRQTV